MPNYRGPTPGPRNIYIPIYIYIYIRLAALCHVCHGHNHNAVPLHLIIFLTPYPKACFVAHSLGSTAVAWMLHSPVGKTKVRDRGRVRVRGKGLGLEST